LPRRPVRPRLRRARDRRPARRRPADPARRTHAAGRARREVREPAVRPRGVRVSGRYAGYAGAARPTVDPGGVAWGAAIVAVPAALPLVFDAVPARAVVFTPWALVLGVAGWACCALAPVPVRRRCRAMFATGFVLRIVVVALLVYFDFWQEDE